MNREQFFPYLRVQTTALVLWWAALMFLAWVKPGLATTLVTPHWILLAALASATMTAVCLPAGAAPREFGERRLAAVAFGVIAGLGVAVGTNSPDFGLVAGLVAWGGLVSVLAPPHRLIKS